MQPEEFGLPLAIHGDRVLQWQSFNQGRALAEGDIWLVEMG
jgi:hypothetical protein